MRSIIKHIKYRLVTDAFPDLFNALDANALKPLAELSRLCRDAVYVPVPLHPSKMRVRGFNQAERIARFCALFTGTPISDIVERTALTNAQAQLRTRRERMLNMTGAFRIRECEGETLKGKTAIIIDDVITSGSTVKSLANILSRGGVTRIYGVSLARG